MRIVLSGYYGFDNAGDEALLAAITSSIHQYAPEAEFTVLSGAPQKTQALHQIDAVHYMNPIKLVTTLAHCDLLISGGGSIFQDVTSARSLPYYIGVVALARLLRRPVVFYAQGVGPINRRFSKFLMRLIANHVNFISLRDEASMQFLRELGVTRPPMKVTADPVFALTPRPEDFSEIQNYLETINPEHKPLVGVSLRSWKKLDGYQPVLAAQLDELCKQGYRILFIPLAFPEDIQASEKTAACMQQPSVVLKERCFSSEQHLALISQLKLMIGMRLHALVFAARDGIPFAGISYDPKVEAFLSIFEMEPLPLQQPGMQQQIQSLLLDQQKHQQLTQQAQELREKACENAQIALRIIDQTAPEKAKNADLPEPVSASSSEPEPELPSGNSKHTGRNFLAVAIAIFFSKALGFLRDVLFASVFGTTIITDAYQTIFSLPSLLFSSIGNALSAVNIPDLTDHLKNRGKAESQAYIANLFSQITLLGTILSVLGIIVAPAITHLLAPGLDADMNKISVTLCRIMMPTLLFVNLTYFSMGILQVHGHFLLSSLVSLPFNVIIILALFLRPGDLLFLGYMTTLGWLMQYLIQCPVLLKYGYHMGRKLNFRDPYSINLYRNLFPILLGNSLLQLCLIIDRSFATHLEDGTAAALSFGSNLFMTITSVIVVAMTTVIFPRLSSYCLALDFVKIRALMQNVFKVFLFILLPYLVLVICYHQQIIALVYERGAFNAHSTYLTALSFLFYSFAVVGYACQEVFNRVYYAMKKFKIPMLVSFLCLLLNALCTLFFYQQFHITGIALSTSCCMLLYAFIMYFLLRHEIGGGMFASVPAYFLRLLLPLGGMLGVVGLGQIYLGSDVSAAFITAVVSGLVYLAIAFGLKLHRVIFANENNE